MKHKVLIIKFLLIFNNKINKKEQSQIVCFVFMNVIQFSL